MAAAKALAVVEDDELELDDTPDADEEEVQPKERKRMTAMTTTRRRRKKTAAKSKENPGSGNMTTILLIGGAVVVGYWYITSYGPRGAVKDATGNKVNPSWWDQWFGSSTSAVQPVQPAPGPAVNPGGGNTAPTPPATAPPLAPSYTTDQVKAVISTDAGNSGYTTLDIDQWSWFLNKNFPTHVVPGEAVDNMLAYGIAHNVIADRSTPINVDTYMSLLVNQGRVGLSGAGVGDIVPAYTWGSGRRGWGGTGRPN